jgi:hypothetical protein
MLIGCYCSVLYHMLTDISHPRIGVADDSSLRQAKD